MTEGQFILTNIFVRKNEALGKRMYEVTFLNRDQNKKEPLRMVIHEVELKKLTADLQKLITGEYQVAATEGLYIDYGHSEGASPHDEGEAKPRTPGGS